MKTYTVDVYDNGGEEWFLNGNRHREDGPAIEYADGSKRWYLNDKMHREDGPAIERADGYKAWYLNGKMHREDGPAIERAAGYKAWYLNGEQLSEAEFNARTKPTASCEGKVVEVDGVKYKLVKAWHLQKFIHSLIMINEFELAEIFVANNFSRFKTNEYLKQNQIPLPSPRVFFWAELIAQQIVCHSQRNWDCRHNFDCRGWRRARFSRNARRCRSDL